MAGFPYFKPADFALLSILSLLLSVFILCVRIVLVLSLFVVVLEFSLGIIINTCKED